MQLARPLALTGLGLTTLWSWAGATLCWHEGRLRSDLEDCRGLIVGIASPFSLASGTSAAEL